MASHRLTTTAGAALIVSGTFLFTAGASSAALPANCTERNDQIQCVFRFTGGEQAFTVPSGVTEIGFVAMGAHGGVPSGGTGLGTPGAGAFGNAIVQPGQTVYVQVGGRGGNGTGKAGGTGGYNGGGTGGSATTDAKAGGGGGGGASDVRTTSRAKPGSLESRLVTAPGGGGLGTGGGTRGADGSLGAGGAGGDASATGGTAGTGGAGASCANGGGGGGGAGIFGGGGGGCGANGGNGSAYLSAGPMADGNGAIVITYRPATNAPNSAPAASDDTFDATIGEPLTVAAPGVLGNDTDPENNALTAKLGTPPANGDLVLNPDGSFTYTAKPDTKATEDSFTYSTTDGSADSNPATVKIALAPAPVTPEPEPEPEPEPLPEPEPSAAAPTIAVVKGLKCTSDIAGTFALLVADADTPVENLSVTATSSDKSALRWWSLKVAGTGADRSISITTSKTGTATVTVTVSDGSQKSTATINVARGGNGAEKITGSDGPDLLLGDRGNDAISGGAGPDVLCGGNGDDVLTGDDGPDAMDGGRGTDSAIGTTEEDVTASIP